MTSSGSQTSGILILDILDQVHEESRTSKKIPILSGKRVPDTTQCPVWSAARKGMKKGKKRIKFRPLESGISLMAVGTKIFFLAKWAFVER